MGLGINTFFQNLHEIPVNDDVQLIQPSGHVCLTYAIQPIYVVYFMEELGVYIHDSYLLKFSKVKFVI